MPDFLGYCLKSALETYADVVCINAYEQYANGSLNKLLPFVQSESIVENNEDKDELIKSLYYANNSKEYNYYGQNIRNPWGKFIRTKLIKDNNIQFPIGVPLGEDGIFNFYLFFYAKTIAFRNVYLYKYYTINLSASGTYRENLYELTCKEYDALHEAVEKTKYSFKDIDSLFWLNYSSLLVINIMKSPKSAIRKVNAIYNCLRSTYSLKINGTTLGEFYINTEKKNKYNLKTRIKKNVKSCLIRHHWYYSLAVIMYVRMNRRIQTMYKTETK